MSNGYKEHTSVTQNTFHFPLLSFISIFSHNLLSAIAVSSSCHYWTGRDASDCLPLLYMWKEVSLTRLPQVPHEEPPGPPAQEEVPVYRLRLHNKQKDQFSQPPRKPQAAEPQQRAFSGIHRVHAALPRVQPSGLRQAHRQRPGAQTASLQVLRL